MFFSVFHLNDEKQNQTCFSVNLVKYNKKYFYTNYFFILCRLVHFISDYNNCRVRMFDFKGLDESEFLNDALLELHLK